ncbi:MAG: PAS domain S-box protein, partial [Pseudomonadales bacterium]
MMLHNRYLSFSIGAAPVIAAVLGVAVATHRPDLAPWAIAGVAALTLLGYALSRQQKRRALGRFMRAFDDAPAGLILLDLEGRIDWANRSIEVMTGRTLEEIGGQHLSDLMSGDSWEKVQNQRRALLEGGRVDLEGYLTTSTGRTVWTSAHATLLRNDAGKPEYMVIQVLDQSAARDAQSQASLYEARLQRTLDLSTDAIINTDHSGRITYANSAAMDLLTHPGERLEGRNILDYVAQDEHKGFIGAFKKCQVNAGRPAEFTKLKLHPGGRAVKTAAVHFVSASMTGMGDKENAIALVCKDTHEQMASLAQLRSSEARFSRIFHTSPDAILIVRQHDSLILDFNASFTRLLGYSREEAIGCLETDLGLFADPSERRMIVRELERTSEATDLETQLKTRDGRLISVQISLRYVEIDGELCTLCIGRDISERLEAEAALRASEEKFQQVFRRSPDGIVILRQKDLTIYDINDSFLLAAQYSREELIGKTLYELSVFADHDALEQATDALSHQGFFSNREMVFHTKNGFRVESLVSATYVEIGNEPCILCIAKNVNELRRAEEKLRESEQRFRSAFENSPVGILLVDLKGNVFQANNFAMEMLGFEKRSLEGNHVSRLVPQEDRNQLKETLRRLVSGRDDTVRTECRMLREDKGEIWTTLHAVVQRDSSGNPGYLIAQIADITEMKSNRSKMERMAFYDTLTNLANRRLFYDRLGQAVDHAQRSRHLSALLFLDLDQFKRVNDTLGHEVGDVLLQEVSTRLTSCVRKEDTVARLGGDEFTVLLFDIKSPSDASFVADKILNALRQPLNISGHQLVITTSIGITIVPQDGTDPNSLMKNADLAMYRAKEHGRNTYHFYSEEMNTNAIKRLRTEYELRRAFERNEFVLYYQPKVRLSDRQIVGVECLIRWNHPERGILAPIEFIEVAEETGAIVELGKWIIQEACRTGKVLTDQAGRSIQIAVNISPRQFRDPGLVATIRRSLRETGMEPSSLEIEITETMLMGDVDAATTTVRQLHALGVRLAIDDFGTGYSSLNYLKKFPINTVKVDRSFIMDIPDSADDKAITSAVIAMAHR